MRGPRSPDGIPRIVRCGGRKSRGQQHRGLLSGRSFAARGFAGRGPQLPGHRIPPGASSAPSRAWELSNSTVPGRRARVDHGHAGAFRRHPEPAGAAGFPLSPRTAGRFPGVIRSPPVTRTSRQASRAARGTGGGLPRPGHAPIQPFIVRRRISSHPAGCADARGIDVGGGPAWATFCWPCPSRSWPSPAASTQRATAGGGAGIRLRRPRTPVTRPVSPNRTC